MKGSARLAAVIALALAGACNRADTNEQAREVAADVQQVAARAGDQIADSWVTTKIQAQYFADEDIKARHIDVVTRDGVVTLKGYVENTQTREQAEQIAKNTDGVRDVQNELLIGVAPSAVATGDKPAAGPSQPVATSGRSPEPSTLTRIDDTRITAMVQAQYFADTVVKGRRIDVDTSNGVVTLRGEVASEDERNQALVVARNTEGVQRVEDHLKVDASLASTKE